MSKTKAMYPAPVYVATLDDGRTIRMTVFQDKSAPEKGYDWEACRRTILGVGDPLGADQVAFYTHTAVYSSRGKYEGKKEIPVMQRASYADMGRQIVAAHLEQSGAILSRDPEFHADAKCLGRDFAKRKKSAVSPKQLRQWLDQIINAPADWRGQIIGGIATRLGMAEAGAD